MEKSKKTVAVFFGGPSYEREISILTGVFVLNILKSSKFNLIPVHILSDGSMLTSNEMFAIDYFTAPKRKAQKVCLLGGALYREGIHLKKIADIDCALNCCHGGIGEGGGLSALLEFSGIQDASPDTATSAVFLDKVLTKYVVAGMGVPFAPFCAFSRNKNGEYSEIIKEVEDTLGYPVIVKPARLGSSIGISTANGKEELLKALSTAFSYDDRVLVEKYLEGKRDIHAAVYGAGGEFFVSECEEPFSKEEIFSFGEKYLRGGKTRRSRIPADIPPTAREEIRRIALGVYKRLGMRGVVRADFLLLGDKVYFSELNTVPGSLAYYLFSEKFKDAEKLFVSLIEEGMARGEKERDYPATGILKTVKFAPKTPRV